MEKDSHTSNARSNRTTKNNVIVFRNNSDCSVVEILSPKDNDNDNDNVRIIEAFCVHVQPRACSRAVKELSSTFPLEDGLSHLKRVRRRPLSSSTSSEAISIAIATDPQESKKNTGKPENGDACNSTAPISTSSPAISRPKKRLKSNYVLELLIGTRSRLVSSGESSSSSFSVAKKEPSLEDHPIVREFGPLHSVMVPKYDPRSEQEWKEHNASWPTHYYPLKFDGYLRQQSALSETEIDRMKEFMNQCISTRSVLIIDPNHIPINPRMNEIGNEENTSVGNDNDPDAIISISRKERKLQIQQSQQQERQQKLSSTSLLGSNPLATPVLLALQGVCRREREASISVNATAVGAPIAEPDPNTNPGDIERGQQQQQQRRQQYLCTGYDLYSFYEPNIYEAMACLHSRLRRLVYFVPESQDSPSSDRSADGDVVAWGRGISKHDVHHLPGTNHNFRAFEYRRSSYFP